MREIGKSGEGGRVYFHSLLYYWYENNLASISLVQFLVDIIANAVPSYSIKKYKYNVKNIRK